MANSLLNSLVLPLSQIPDLRILSRNSESCGNELGREGGLTNNERRSAPFSQNIGTHVLNLHGEPHTMRVGTKRWERAGYSFPTLRTLRKAS